MDQAILNTYAVIPADKGDSDWMADASCVGIDTELFFPDKGERVDPMVAKMCNGCSVKAECLAYAIKYSMTGTWANTSERKRDRLRADMNRQKISS